MPLPGFRSPLLGASKGPLTKTYRGKLATTGGAHDPQSMGTIAIGNPSSTRIVVVGLASGRASGMDTVKVESATIGGVTATMLPCNTSTGAIRAQMFYAVVPSGTTAEIIVQFGWDYHTRQTAFVWTIENADQLTPKNTDFLEASTTTVTVTETVEAGAVICAVMSGVAGAPSGWTNLTQDETYTAGDSQTHAAASGVGPQTSVAVTTASTGEKQLAMTAWK